MIRRWSAPKGSSPQGSPARHRGQPELYLLLMYPHMQTQHPGAFPHWRHLIAWCISSSWHSKHLHLTRAPGISSPQAGGTQISWFSVMSQEGGGVDEIGPSPSYGSTYSISEKYSSSESRGMMLGELTVLKNKQKIISNIKKKYFFLLKKKIISFKKTNFTNLITVMSLVAGEAGVSGISGRSISSLSSSSWAGGAPKAAGGAFLTTLGRTHGWQVCLMFVMIGGGLWGRGAGAGVVGGEVAKVLTNTLDSSDPDGPSILKLDTVVVVITDWLGVWARTPPLSLVEKSNNQAMASRSTSSSSLPSSSNLRLIFRKKGETEWGRTVPLPLVEEDEDPDPYPSSRGGAEGITALGTTKKKKITHYKSHFRRKKKKNLPPTQPALLSP